MNDFKSLGLFWFCWTPYKSFSSIHRLLFKFVKWDFFNNFVLCIYSTLTIYLHHFLLFQLHLQLNALTALLGKLDARKKINCKNACKKSVMMIWVLIYLFFFFKSCHKNVPNNMKKVQKMFRLKQCNNIYWHF